MSVPAASPPTRRALLWACASVALVALLPFARGVLSGQCFYFRDIARQFFPLRRFALEGLLRGELRYWNPYVHEGIPLSLPALSYPLDLIQLLLRDEAGLSLTLALHGPLGALAFLALARGLGLGLTAAAGGAMAYALGGFFLSTLNFYVYFQAAALAPLVVLAVLKAADGRRRWLAGAALLTAIALSTTGAEIVAQALACGAVLALGRVPRSLARAVVAVALGLGLTAPTAATMWSMIAGSVREAGFATSVVLAHSIHPLTLPQIVVANWHGDLLALPNAWWGSRFFPQGFPYLLSFYLGAAMLCAAGVGVAHGRGPRFRLALLAVAGLVLSVGRWAGAEIPVEALPLLRTFRYPSKAFFTVHLAVSLLAASGLDRLAEERRPWRTLAAWSILWGGLLVGVSALPSLFPAATREFLAGFLPRSYDWPARFAAGDAIVADAGAGGWLAIGVAMTAVAVLAGRLPTRRAAWLAAALMVADLLRAGAGLNPTVTPSFYRLSPEMARVAASIRGAGGRAYTCNPEAEPPYFGARALRTEHDVWSFALLMETFTPAFNVGAGVPTAMSLDMTMLVPENRVLDPDQMGSATFAAIAERLVAAGVSHVLCIAPIAHPALREVESLAPARIAPLPVHVYAVQGALPLRAVASAVRAARGRAEAGTLARQPGFQAAGGVAVEGDVSEVAGAHGRIVAARETADRIELDVEADTRTVVVVRDAHAQGWTATVNGTAAPVLRADGRHRAVPVPAGRSRVVLRYRPPGLRAALAIAALSLLGVVALSRLP